MSGNDSLYLWVKYTPERGWVWDIRSPWCVLNSHLWEASRCHSGFGGFCSVVHQCPTEGLHSPPGQTLWQKNPLFLVQAQRLVNIQLGTLLCLSTYKMSWSWKVTLLYPVSILEQNNTQNIYLFIYLFIKCPVLAYLNSVLLEVQTLAITFSANGTGRIFLFACFFNNRFFFC